METPFIFGKIATEKNFTDREKETADLVQNFMSLINTIIISPRRWGKSSLVNKAAKLAMAQAATSESVISTFSMCVAKSISIRCSLKR